MMTALDDAEQTATKLHAFVVIAAPCPQVLLRILGVVAQLSIVPSRLTCEHCNGLIQARIVVDGLPPTRAEMVRDKIANIVMVESAVIEAT